jgi:hypothetical protein
MNPVLLRAIGARKIMLIDYEGHCRVIEPHTYGADANGRELLRAYQPDPRSPVRGWHLFDLTRSGRLIATRLVFCQPRPGYSRGDDAMAHIFAEL